MVPAFGLDIVAIVTQKQTLQRCQVNRNAHPISKFEFDREIRSISEHVIGIDDPFRHRGTQPPERPGINRKWMPILKSNPVPKEHQNRQTNSISQFVFAFDVLDFAVPTDP
jgi:hypothetical protein